jgi:hypothetical protein
MRASTAGAVLLDIQRDAFFGLDAHQAQALSALLSCAERACVGDEPDTLAQSLRADGLIEPVLTAGLPLSANASELPDARTELIPWHRMPAHFIRWHHISSFLKAWWKASHYVRHGHLAGAVETAQLRTKQFDLPTARRLLAIYYHIRAFAFTKRSQCLLDSLTLLEFLATYGQRPTWVIGVQIRPFASHSWLQYRHFVLNGTAAYVRTYLPILVV